MCLAAALSGCTKKTIPDLSTETTEVASPSDVRTFQINPETSKIYFQKNSQEKYDITSFTTNIIDGELYLNPDGIRFIFDLGEREIKPGEKQEFQDAIHNIGLSELTGEYICLSNQEHTLIFQEGYNIYLCDGSVRMLISPCIKLESGEYSIPITDLVFSMGHDSLGTTVNGDAIYYTLIDN